jgi:putative peptidoglycan lipid II flippase
MLLLLVPAAALMLVLSQEITRIVYQRGEFDAAQTDLVAEALFYFALSLPFAGVNLILIRTFFSLQLPWRPTQIALANLGVNAGLDALLYKPMGVGGITLATAIVSLVTSVALAIALRGQLGGLDMARTVRVGTRILAAGALCAAVALGVREALSGLPDTLLDQTVLVVAASAAGLAAYAAVVLAARVEEAHQISALVRQQLARLR